LANNDSSSEFGPTAMWTSAVCILGLVLANKATSAVVDDEVTFLPKYGVPKQRTLAGYVEANRSSSGHLFYMFFEKTGSPPTSETPLLIWLNGGPGASSSLGNFLEHGPYRLQPNGTLTENPTAWNMLAHIIYFDQPVGTGYSYCEADGYVTNMAQLSEQFSAALQNFFGRHPEYRLNPLYICGESYAGVYIPAIAAHILKRVPQIKIAGVLIGNPGNFHYTQYNGQIEFALSHGMIGETEAKLARTLWYECSNMVSRNEMVEAFQKCEEMSTYIFNQAGNPFLYNVAQWGDVYDDVLAPVMEKYLANPEVKKALHVGNHSWKNGDGTSAPNPVVNALNKTLMDSVLPDLETLLEHHVPVRVYAGVLDGSSCNHRSVFESLTMLKWPGIASFLAAPREKWTVPGDSHPSGYTQSGGGLAFVWVANSGHLVPTDQPRAALDMLRVFLQQTQLPLPSQMDTAHVQLVI